jgi:hypothetical protein
MRSLELSPYSCTSCHEEDYMYNLHTVCNCDHSILMERDPSGLLAQQWTHGRESTKL